MPTLVLQKRHPVSQNVIYPTSRGVKYCISMRRKAFLQYHVREKGNRRIPQAASEVHLVRLHLAIKDGGVVLLIEGANLMEDEPRGSA